MKFSTLFPIVSLVAAAPHLGHSVSAAVREGAQVARAATPAIEEAGVRGIAGIASSSAQHAVAPSALNLEATAARHTAEIAETGLEQAAKTPAKKAWFRNPFNIKHPEPKPQTPQELRKSFRNTAIWSGLGGAALGAAVVGGEKHH